MSLFNDLRDAWIARENRQRELEVRRQILESMSTADLATIALAADELGWQRLTGPQNDNGNDFTDLDRIKLIQRSRLYWHRDPYAKQAVRLYTSYALGQGVQFKHSDPKAQKFLDGVVADSLNRKWLGKTGMRKLSNKLLVDGELMIAVFTANPARPQIRPVDPIQISEIIANPEDEADLWYFHRLKPGRKAADGQIDVFYRAADADFTAMNGGEAKALRQLGGQADMIRSHLNPHAVLIHKAINSLGLRGYPLLTASLDWTKQLRRFMEDRAIITHAAAQFAYKKTVKGGPSTLANLSQSLRDGSQSVPGGVQSTGYDRRGPIGGATLVQNGGVDTEQFRFDTMAANARADADLLKLHFMTGVGAPAHYFSDNSTGNLATATSMERPVELIFSDYQLEFTDALFMIARECLEAAGYDADGLEIVTPPILNVDVPAFLNALTTLLKTDPNFSIDPIWRKILTLIQVGDLDKALKLIQAKVDKQDGVQDKAIEAQQAQSDLQIAAAKQQAEHAPKLLQFQLKQAELQQQAAELQAQHAPTLLQHQVDQSELAVQQAKLQAQHAPTLLDHQVKQSEAQTNQIKAQAEHAPRVAKAQADQAEHGATQSGAQAGVADRLAAAQAEQAEHAATQAATQAQHAPDMAQHAKDQQAAATVQAAAQAKHAELHADIAAQQAQRQNEQGAHQHQAIMSAPAQVPAPDNGPAPPGQPKKNQEHE